MQLVKVAGIARMPSILRLPRRGPNQSSLPATSFAGVGVMWVPTASIESRAGGWKMDRRSMIRKDAAHPLCGAPPQGGGTRHPGGRESASNLRRFSDWLLRRDVTREPSLGSRIEKPGVFRELNRLLAWTGPRRVARGRHDGTSAVDAEGIEIRDLFQRPFRQGAKQQRWKGERAGELAEPRHPSLVTTSVLTATAAVLCPLRGLGFRL